MPLPRWLDRIWLVCIALSFCLLLPIWLILSIERMGYRFVFGAIALALIIRYRSNKRAASGQSSDHAGPPTEP